MNFAKLYKTDSKGKTREWFVEVIDCGTYADIEVNHGELGGKMQTKITHISSGKNIGKANETSYLDQANSEAQSKWNKQLDKGYSLTGTKTFLPMLALSFDKQKDKVVYPCYVQPKLDGLRCWIAWDETLERPVARSRKGKEWKSIIHIIESVKEFLVKNKNIILDGEIYCDPQIMSFQGILSAIKRDQPNEHSLSASFWCYDLYDINNPNLIFKERSAIINTINSDVFFVKVDTFLANNPADIIAYHKAFTTVNGYEGAMVRNIDSVYKVDGRSSDLLKLKYFQDAEYKIVDKTIDKNGECVFVCLDEKLNETFECKPEGSHEERVQYLEDDNIGEYLTIRFFELTDKGIPRFPVGVAVRLKEDF